MTHVRIRLKALYLDVGDGDAFRAKTLACCCGLNSNGVLSRYPLRGVIGELRLHLVQLVGVIFSGFKGFCWSPIFYMLPHHQYLQFIGKIGAPRSVVRWHAPLSGNSLV
jgi:hypothetical protein